MSFDSHASDVVSAAVNAINLLTPGHALGREYRAQCLVRRVIEILAHLKNERGIAEWCDFHAKEDQL